MKTLYDRMRRKWRPIEPFFHDPIDIAYRWPGWFLPPEPGPEWTNMREDGSGRVVDEEAVLIGETKYYRNPFSFSPLKPINPLVLVVGTPGSGKSTLLKTWLANYRRLSGEGGKPIVVLDPEGEYDILTNDYGEDMRIVRMGAGEDTINIFGRPDKSIKPTTWYSHVLDLLPEFLQLGHAPLSQSLLRTIVMEELVKRHGFTEDPSTWDAPDITLEEVYETVRREMYKAREEGGREASRKLEGLITLHNRLQSWYHDPGYRTFFGRGRVFDLNSIFNYRLTVFDCSHLPRNAYGLFAKWLVKVIYTWMLLWRPLHKPGLRLYLFVDEAWSLLRATGSGEEKENIVEEMARRCRKYGIALILSTQTPEDVDPKMFSLFGTLAVGIVPSQKMVETIIASRGAPPIHAEQIKNLPRGTFAWFINWAERDVVPFSKEPIYVRTLYPYVATAELVY